MRGKRKAITITLVLIVIAAIVCGIIFFPKWFSKTGTSVGKRVQMNTVTLEKTDLTESVSATGTIGSGDIRLASAQVQDIKVKNVLVQVGDTVQKGQTLVTFNTKSLKQALKQAKEDYKKRAAQLSETDDTVEKEKIDLDEIAPLEPEKGSVAEPKTEEAIQPEPEAVPDKQAERADLETGTLAKILKEAEEIKAENDSGEGEPDAVGSGWGVAETLARLEAMQAENDSLLKEIEEDGEYFEDKVKVSNFDDFEPQTDNSEKPIISSLEEELMDSEVPHSGVIEPEVPTERRRVRRFGLGNRDTNRSGRKFTEEELMEQIRD